MDMVEILSGILGFGFGWIAAHVFFDCETKSYDRIIALVCFVLWIILRGCGHMKFV